MALAEHSVTFLITLLLLSIHVWLLLQHSRLFFLKTYTNAPPLMSRWLYNWPPTKRYFPLTLSTKQCRALGPLIQLRSPLRRCSTLFLLSGRFDHFTCDVAAPSSCVMGLYVLLSELGSLVHTITKRRRGNFGSRCPGICMNTSVACPMRKHFSVWTGVHGDKRVAVTNNLI